MNDENMTQSGNGCDTWSEHGYTSTTYNCIKKGTQFNVTIVNPTRIDWWRGQHDRHLIQHK
jgi:hypothetical protein